MEESLREASPQIEALPPILNLTPVADGWRQEEDVDSDADSDVDGDVDSGVDSEKEPSDWADQVEEESNEEGSKRDRIDRKPETEEEVQLREGLEVIEELHRRLAHGATGPPTVCRDIAGTVCRDIAAAA